MEIQRNKSMAEIMYDVNNSPKFKTFQIRERIIRTFFKILIATVNVYGFIAYLVHSSEEIKKD